MPGAGSGPPEGSTMNQKRDWYNVNLGQYFIDGKTNMEHSRIGLKEDQDGDKFAAYWHDKTQTLEAKMKTGKWDQWMKIENMASGVDHFPEAFKAAGTAITATRVHLNLDPLATKDIRSKLFVMAELTGNIIQRLREEDSEKWRTGGKPSNVVVGKGEIADRLKATPEFIAALTEDERKNFAVETMSSGTPAKVNTGLWEIFDPVATKEKWISRVSNIEAVIKRVDDAYMEEPKPKDHYAQIKAMEDVNNKIKNWNVPTSPVCLVPE
ncbi:hypothetical protein BGZ60DRAFT_392563 [Tricladium varicosporioides]|nr:hypothetical protein BGZ60DRAFT_392563 [Hymenoscyphus varicosporioides]